MSRIRSIFPGIFTDDAYVSVSFAARWFVMGLMTDADDNGVFEWKPTQLKMKLLPADMCDVHDLLAELEGAFIIRRYTIGDPDVMARHAKRPVLLGAIRNFVRWQKPRRPKIIWPITKEIQEFVGIDEPEISADLFADEEPDLSGKAAVKASSKPQMSGIDSVHHIGGGMRDEGGGRIPPPPFSENGSIPDQPFLPPEPEWSEFVRHRQRMRKPLTAHAKNLLRNKLQKLAAEGNDPIDVINQSIMLGWQGLFAVKDDRNAKRNREHEQDISDPLLRRYVENGGSLSRKN